MLQCVRGHRLSALRCCSVGFAAFGWMWADLTALYSHCRIHLATSVIKKHQLAHFIGSHPRPDHNIFLPHDVVCFGADLGIFGLASCPFRLSLTLRPALLWRSVSYLVVFCLSFPWVCFFVLEINEEPSLLFSGLLHLGPHHNYWWHFPVLKCYQWFASCCIYTHVGVSWL